MTSWEQPLQVPDLIEDDCIDLIQRRHPEHLAKLERQLGLAPQTIERFRTIDVLAGDTFRLREDKPPACLLGVFGTTGTPQKNNRRDSIDMQWSLAIQITVIGIDRRDTLKRRNWMSLTVAECLMARLPRKNLPVSQVILDDIDLVNGADESTQRTFAEARMMLTVGVRDAINVAVFPVDDSGYEAGLPGGPPDPTYGSPLPWPDIGTVTPDVDISDLDEE